MPVTLVSGPDQVGALVGEEKTAHNCARLRSVARRRLAVASSGSSPTLFHRPGPMKIVRDRVPLANDLDRLGENRIHTSVVAASLGSFKSSNASPSGDLA